MNCILIVDDDPNIRRIIREMIECMEAWEVCGEAADGLQAVECALLSRPDVVIMDIQMPNMNGFDASRRMTISSPNSKILIISVENSLHHSRAAEASGARGFLTKSKVGEYLDAALSALVENRTYFSHSNQVFVAITQKVTARRA